MCDELTCSGNMNHRKMGGECKLGLPTGLEKNVCALNNSGFVCRNGQLKLFCGGKEDLASLALSDPGNLAKLSFFSSINFYWFFFRFTGINKIHNRYGI